MEPIYLRALELSDLERTYKWHNDPELYKTLLGTFHYASRTTEEEWLRKKTAYSPSEVNLAVCVRGTDAHIGNFYITNIDWVSRVAAMGMLIGEPVERGKGYGTTALRLMLDYVFGVLGLNRVWAGVLEDNPASLRILEKCDFKMEGRLRKHAFKDGKFKDVFILAFCASDWQPPEESSRAGGRQ